MRIIAVLLSILLLTPPAPAIKRKVQEMNVDETLKYMNDRLIVNVNWGDMKCSVKLELSIPEGRREIILKYLPIDKHRREIEDLPPRYIYHIPVDSVTRVYPYGRSPWQMYDRVVIRTYSHAVEKIGPIWNCDKKRINPVPKMRLLDEADLFLDNPDDGNLKGVINGVRRLVKLLQEEASAQTGQQDFELPDDNDE